VSYGLMRGDYGASYGRGDPGLFGFIKKVGGGLIGRALKMTPAGVAAGTLLGLVGGKRIGRPGRMPAMPGLGMPLAQLKVGGVKGFLQRAIPGGKTGYEMGAKRRRMNVANPKALRRSIRRQAGFVKLARKALKGTGYAIVSKGSRRPTRPLNIRESGPGSVSVRR